VHLSHLMTPPEVDYVLRAVLEVARDGWKLLPQYDMSPSGMYVHSTHRTMGDPGSGGLSSSAGALMFAPGCPAAGDGIRAAVDGILRGLPPPMATAAAVADHTVSMNSGSLSPVGRSTPKSLFTTHEPSAPLSPPAQRKEQGALAKVWGTLRRASPQLRLRGRSAARGGSDRSTPAAAVAVGTAEPPPLPPTRRQAQLKAQKRRAEEVYSMAEMAAHNGHPWGTEWEEEQGRGSSDYVTACVRDDRWMLMPHEASTALRRGEDLSWMRKHAPAFVKAQQGTEIWHL
jgi:hypothetical protein